MAQPSRAKLSTSQMGVHNLQMYRDRLTILEDCSGDFNRFLKLSVMRMSAKRLRNSLSKGAGPDARVYERHFQNEWYRRVGFRV